MFKKRKAEKRAENIAKLEAELFPETKEEDPFIRRARRFDEKLQKHRALRKEHLAFRMQQRGIYLPDSVEKIDPRKTYPMHH